MQNEWSKMAANFLKSELAKSGLGYDALTERLNAIGVLETYQAIAAKINRGTFSFAFFMQCMKALDKKEIRL